MSKTKAKANAFRKQWVVLRWSNGTETIVPDYGGYAWGRARYEVVGYYKTRKEAMEAIRELRAEADRLEAMYGDPTPGEIGPLSPEMAEFLENLKKRMTTR